MVDVDAAERRVFLNSVGVSSRECLLPDVSGAWTILSGDGSRRITGGFPQHSLPAESDVQSLTALGEMLRNTSSGTWQELGGIAPTVPDLGTRIRLRPLERAILRYLPYLEEACARPNAYLKFETTRVFVSQARRIPARALSYLAAHTEDWERPTLRSVRPKRVLAEVREDELDIYENRLAARLVDRLLRVIHPRIAEVRKAQRMFSDLLDYSKSTGGSHWRAERICSLWAETLSAGQNEKRSRTTLEQLLAIRQRLLALMDSPLYGSIPRRADVSDSLKMTNILTTDPVYKHVAMLWLEWSRHAARKPKTPTEVFAEYRNFCKSFSEFCLLLVVRALSQFGISADAGEADFPIAPGTTVRLSRTDLRLAVLSNGVIQLCAEARVLMSFVPLPAAINRARGDDELENWLGGIYSDLHEVSASSHTIVLYLSSVAGASKTLSPRANRRVRTIGNEPSGTGLRKFGFLPVSPWEIDCVERVGRCVRWALTGRDLLLYPVTVNAVLPSQLRDRDLPLWLAPAGARLQIVRHPRPHEWHASQIDMIWETAKQNMDAALAEEKRVVAKQERGRIAPHQRQALAQDVTRSKKALREARRLYEQVDLFRCEVRRILCTADISNCPVCSTPADPALAFKRDANFYQFACSDCNARWGVRTCRCGERVPFIDTGSAGLPVERAPGWIDRYLGSDVLAIPDGGGSFECWACGEPV
jgi:hypothetical protein